MSKHKTTQILDGRRCLNQAIALLDNGSIADAAEIALRAASYLLSSSNAKPWRGPWEWAFDEDDGQWNLQASHYNGLEGFALEATDQKIVVWLGPGVGQRDEEFGSLTAALAYIRALSSDPVPTPPQEMWEMRGEPVPEGWVRVDDGPWASTGAWRHGKTIYSAQRIAQGRECVDELCARDHLPPLPDEAFKVTR
jgi:hypothetical protein